MNVSITVGIGAISIAVTRVAPGAVMGIGACSGHVELDACRKDIYVDPTRRVRKIGCWVGRMYVLLGRSAH